MGKNKSHKIIQTDDLIQIAHTVVGKYVARGAIPVRDKEDVAMNIVEKFLSGEDKINKAYKGDAKVSTYCIAIANRMCCEIIRKDYRQWQQVQPDSDDITYNKGTSYYETEKNAVINSELKRLQYILDYFNEEKSKTIVFLKFIMGITIKKEEVQALSQKQHFELFNEFQRNKDAALSVRYNKLAEIVKQHEGSNVKGDAVRMWLNKKIDTIISRLNANGFSQYDRESVGILFEML